PWGAGAARPGRPSRGGGAGWGSPRRRDSPPPHERPRSRRAAPRSNLPLTPLPRRSVCPPERRFASPRSSSLELASAVDARRRPRDRLQPLRADRVAAVRADPVRAIVDGAERRLDPRQLEARAVAQREVPLLL